MIDADQPCFGVDGRLAWGGPPGDMTSRAAVLVRMIRALMDASPTTGSRAALATPETILADAGFSAAQIASVGSLAANAYRLHRAQHSVAQADLSAATTTYVRKLANAAAQTGHWRLRDIVTQTNAADIAMLLVEIVSRVTLLGPQAPAKRQERQP